MVHQNTLKNKQGQTPLDKGFDRRDADIIHLLITPQSQRGIPTKIEEVEEGTSRLYATRARESNTTKSGVGLNTTTLRNMAALQSNC